MFAIFLHKGLDPFYQNISSFPTVVYTFLLLVVVIYWASAILGLIDLDFPEIDLDAVDLNADSPHTGTDVLAALMLRMGLTGVPAVVSFSLVILIGWLACYFVVHFVLRLLPDAFLIRLIAGVPILIATFFFAMLVTSKLIAPLRPLFKNASYQAKKHMLGQVAVVRTSRVDNTFGEAVLDDGGAGLIIKVRSSGEERFKQGDRVVLFEKIDEGSTYRVISETEFGARP